MFNETLGVVGGNGARGFSLGGFGSLEVFALVLAKKGFWGF